MDRKMLLNIPPCKAPKSNSTKSVIAVSQILVDERIEESNITEVDLYRSNKLRARWFGIKNDSEYAIYIIGQGWKAVKLINAARIIQGKRPLKGEEIYFYGSEFKWDSKDDEARVYGELNSSIGSFEYNVSRSKREDAYKRKVKSVDELMSTIPTVQE